MVPSAADAVVCSEHDTSSLEGTTMSKRLTAALTSLLMLASVLAVVPLATAEPASAHPTAKTVQRCVVDPPINHCWTQTVNVAHTHTCPAGTTGTYPNCKRVERDDRTSEQAAGDEKKRQQEEAERKRKAEEAKRKANEQRKAEEERKRREAEKKECPDDAIAKTGESLELIDP